MSMLHKKSLWDAYSILMENCSLQQIRSNRNHELETGIITRKKNNYVKRKQRARSQKTLKNCKADTKRACMSQITSHINQQIRSLSATKERQKINLTEMDLRNIQTQNKLQQARRTVEQLTQTQRKSQAQIQRLQSKIIEIKDKMMKLVQQIEENEQTYKRKTEQNLNNYLQSLQKITQQNQKQSSIQKQFLERQVRKLRQRIQKLLEEQKIINLKINQQKVKKQQLQKKLINVQNSLKNQIQINQEQEKQLQKSKKEIDKTKNEIKKQINARMSNHSKEHHKLNQQMYSQSNGSDSAKSILRQSCNIQTKCDLQQEKQQTGRQYQNFYANLMRFYQNRAFGAQLVDYKTLFKTIQQYIKHASDVIINEIFERALQFALKDNQQLDLPLACPKIQKQHFDRALNAKFMQICG